MPGYEAPHRFCEGVGCKHKYSVPPGEKRRRCKCGLLLCEDCKAKHDALPKGPGSMIHHMTGKRR